MAFVRYDGSALRIASVYLIHPEGKRASIPVEAPALTSRRLPPSGLLVDPETLARGHTVCGTRPQEDLPCHRRIARLDSPSPH